MTQPESIIEFTDTSWETDLKERVSQQLEQRGKVDEIELGQMLADALNDGPGRFVFSQGQFWCFISDAGLYVPIDDVELQKLLFQLHDAKGHDRYRHKFTKPLIDRLLKIVSVYLNDKHFFQNSLKGLATIDGFIVINNDKVEIKNHDAKYRARWKVPAAFSPLVETDRTRERLEEILCGKENARSFLEILGITLFGLGAEFGRMLVLVGDGANGKSTIVEIMRHMVPAGIRSSVPLEDFKQDYSRVDLDGKILNTCEEFPTLSKVDVQAVKNIVTGGDIQARYVRGNAFTMKPIAQHVICTNYLPPLHENNEALRRRLIVLRLDKTIPVEKRDLNFAQNFFKEHGDALLMLATRALEDALKRGRLYEPSTSARLVDQWLNKSDCIGSFISQCVDRTGNPKDTIKVQEMHDACVRYARQNDFSPPTSLRAFGSVLAAAGFKRGKSSSMQWVGVKLRADDWEDREE